MATAQLQTPHEFKQSRAETSIPETHNNWPNSQPDLSSYQMWSCKGPMAGKEQHGQERSRGGRDPPAPTEQRLNENQGGNK